MKYSVTYQSHDLPHGALDVQHFGALNTNQTPLGTELRKEDVGAVHLHHLADLVQTVEQDVVDLVRVDNDILDVDLHAHHKFLKLLLRTCNLLLRITGDVDLVLAATMSTRRRVAENARERRREVNGRASGSLDQLDVLASTAADQGVHGQLQLHSVHVTFELVTVSLSDVDRSEERTHNLIDHNQDPGLGMLSALHIAVDGHPEALIQPIVRGVSIRRHHRTIRVADFRAQEEDVRARIGRQRIQMLQDARSDIFGGSIQDQVHVHVHGRTSL